MQDEILRIFKSQNCTSILCLALEGGSRQKGLQQGSRLPDDTISNICKTLKLSALQTVAFAFAISKSQYKVLAQDAIKLLRSKLPEISIGTDFNEVHNDIIHNLSILVASSEVMFNRYFKFNYRIILVYFN